jgi:hypothetical protein
MFRTKLPSISVYMHMHHKTPIQICTAKLKTPRNATLYRTDSYTAHRILEVRTELA